MTVFVRSAPEFDNDLRILRLAAELGNDAALDLAESRPATWTVPT